MTKTVFLLLLVWPLMAAETAAKPARKAVNARALARAMARKHRVPAAMIQSIIAAESGFNAGAHSGRGAVGLMQVMPATAAMYGLDASDPEQNVDAGARYLRFLVDRYRKYRDWMRRVIAAYNAGPAAVDRYRGVPPFPETQSYVARVLLLIEQFERDPA